MSTRVLFPLLLSWGTKTLPPDCQYGNGKWAVYQAMRFLFIWASLSVISVAGGIMAMLVVAGLFGLTYRFDYWSNCVELLAASLAFASLAFGFPWYYGLAAGLVLGTGRETIFLLALVGNPFSIALGVGAALAQVIVRSQYKRDATLPFAHREKEIGYGWHDGWKIRWNVEALLGGHKIDRAGMFIYASIVILSFTVQPLLAAVLVAVTVPLAQINEPRIAVMLVPFAAETLCKLM